MRRKAAASLTEVSLLTWTPTIHASLRAYFFLLLESRNT
jgi:hypothetical protein